MIGPSLTPAFFITTYACLEVADTGCGIAPGDLAKIFDPFSTSKFNGIGLGLPVVLGTAMAHEGCVTVTSELGQGSVFRVFFPELAVVGAYEAGPDRPIPTRNEDGHRTVLVVEDNTELRDTLGLVFESFGVPVLLAADGVEAMKLFRQHRDEIGCVLCDVVMPRMNGWEVLAALRQLAPELPVILASGHNDSKIMHVDTTVHPNAFLHKPFELDVCMKLVQSFITPRG